MFPLSTAEAFCLTALATSAMVAIVAIVAIINRQRFTGAADFKKGVKIESTPPDEVEEIDQSAKSTSPITHTKESRQAAQSAPPPATLPKKKGVKRKNKQTPT